MSIDLLVILILVVWCTYICLRIYSRARLVSFLLVGLSIPMYFFSILLQGILKIAFQIIGNGLFWVGVILMGTYEGSKLKELGTLTTIKDWLIGNIPDKAVSGKFVFSKIEKIIFFSSSFVLIIISLMNYFYYNGDILESIAMFITGSVFCVYYFKLKQSK